MGCHRRILCCHLLLVSVRRYFSSSSSHKPPPTFFSFLHPYIFSSKNLDSSTSPPLRPPPLPQTLTLIQRSELETTLRNSIAGSDTGQAWKSFKSLTSGSGLPPKQLANAIVVHLSSLRDSHSLKRAFASSVFLLEKNPSLLEFESVTFLLEAFLASNLPAPAFSLVRSMLQNRYLMPFKLWGHLIVEISRKNSIVSSFLHIFNELSRLVSEENLHDLTPDLPACNWALHLCCRRLESLPESEKVLESMSVFNLRPDETSCGLLAYLYASKGLQPEMSNLDTLMAAFGYPQTPTFFQSLIEGYSKSHDPDPIRPTVLRALKQGVVFSEQTYSALVSGVLRNGGVNDLARIIIEAEKVQIPTGLTEDTVGFGVVTACISLGQPETAHRVLDEMAAAEEGTANVGVYVPVLRTYCREGRTTEAAHLVAEISSMGLEMEEREYEVVIEAAMSSGDFMSAFSVFREMRRAGVGEAKGGYLTIMAGLTESRRPELMAAFLDEMVGDPRVGVGTHDWNSVVHAYCKAGRVEDAKRTWRRMILLRFEPDDQTYMSLVNGNVAAGRYFEVLMMWHDIKRRIVTDGGAGPVFGHALVDAFLVGLVKGGFFDAVMQVVDKAKELKVFVDKWRYKQTFMESHKKLSLAKLKRTARKRYAFIAFKNWVGLAN